MNDDSPEWTAEDFAKAKPFREVFPDLHAAWKKRGRPPSANPKIHIAFRFDPQVIEAIRATGPGYGARVEKLLRDALAEGKL